MKKGIIFLLIFFLFITSNSGCLSLRESYIPQNLLTDGWYEDFGSEEKGSGFLGLSKWSTKVYRKGEVAYLSVTSVKSLIMESKENLLEKVEDDMEKQAHKYGIEIISSSRTYGGREIAKGHKTLFVIYNGSKGDHDYKIIGEVWSCTKSGISVICMGFSDVSEVEGIKGWQKIVSDPEGSIDDLVGDDGLIYNVICH